MFLNGFCKMSHVRDVYFINIIILDQYSFVLVKVQTVASRQDRAGLEPNHPPIVVQTVYVGRGENSDEEEDYENNSRQSVKSLKRTKSRRKPVKRIRFRKPRPINRRVRPQGRRKNIYDEDLSYPLSPSESDYYYDHY